MSMRTFRLETKGGIIVAEIELLTENEPDAIVYDERVFIRRLMRQPTLQKRMTRVLFRSDDRALHAARGSGLDQ
jgi:hypothetical protein